MSVTIKCIDGDVTTLGDFILKIPYFKTIFDESDEKEIFCPKDKEDVITVFNAVLNQKYKVINEHEKQYFDNLFKYFGLKKSYFKKKCLNAMCSNVCKNRGICFFCAEQIKKEFEINGHVVCYYCGHNYIASQCLRCGRYACRKCENKCVKKHKKEN